MAAPITPDRPKVGVAVFIVRPVRSSTTTTTTTTSMTQPSTIESNPTVAGETAPSIADLEFIIGLRLGSHGANTWALPGGHLELNESFETCAAREVLEETGLNVTNIRFLTATNDIMSTEGKHYVTLYVVCEVDQPDRAREPEICEPNKCAAWEWVRWEQVVTWVAQGHNQEDVETEDQETKAEAGRKMFLPLVNLVKQRPGVVPFLS